MPRGVAFLRAFGGVTIARAFGAWPQLAPRGGAPHGLRGFPIPRPASSLCACACAGRRDKGPAKCSISRKGANGTTGRAGVKAEVLKSADWSRDSLGGGDASALGRGALSLDEDGGLQSEPLRG
jgi:hypothetical protein